MTWLATQWQTVRDFVDSAPLTWLAAHWQDAKDFLNSVFFTAIAGSLAGAFFGAYAAQKVAETSKRRDELLKEMRITNAAIMVSFGICNTLLSAKKQHIRALKENFDTQSASLQAFMENNARGADDGNAIFEHRADFQTLPIIQLPTDILQKQVFESLSLGGRPLSLTTTLGQAVDGLNTAIENRNEFIANHYANRTPDNETFALYFGLPFNGRRVNKVYPDMIQSIYAQADDSIFFSQLLCKDLEEHGNQIAAQFKKRFGKGAPKIARPIFTNAEQEGLMPESENYSDWANMFVKTPEDKRS